MSDDLVQRLRAYCDDGVARGLTDVQADLITAADRIEALETRNRALETLLREAIDDPHANWRLAWRDAVLEALDA